jgi:hypothetical protein
MFLSVSCPHWLVILTNICPLRWFDLTAIIIQMVTNDVKRRLLWFPKKGPAGCCQPGKDAERRNPHYQNRSRPLSFLCNRTRFSKPCLAERTPPRMEQRRQQGINLPLPLSSFEVQPSFNTGWSAMLSREAILTWPRDQGRTNCLSLKSIKPSTRFPTESFGSSIG